MAFIMHKVNVKTDRNETIHNFALKTFVYMVKV